MARDLKLTFPPVSEEAEQCAVIDWAFRMQWRWPELANLFHIPNGGWRYPSQAARFKMMGVRRGVPDLFLPVIKGGYHGLWIEMKSLTGKQSTDQKKWETFLMSEGYRIEVCFGAKAAIAVIEDYMEL